MFYSLHAIRFCSWTFSLLILSRLFFFFFLAHMFWTMIFRGERFHNPNVRIFNDIYINKLKNQFYFLFAYEIGANELVHINFVVFFGIVKLTHHTLFPTNSGIFDDVLVWQLFILNIEKHKHNLLKRWKFNRILKKNKIFQQKQDTHKHTKSCTLPFFARETKSITDRNPKKKKYKFK